MRRFMAGFENGSVDAMEQLRGDPAPSASTSQKRTGNYSMYVPGSASAMAVLSDAPTELYLRFGFYFVSQVGSGCFLCFGDSIMPNHMAFTRNASTKKIELRCGTVSSPVVASGGTVEANTWYCIEMYIKIANAGGIVQVKVDGVLVIDYSGDTRYGTAEGIRCIEIGFWTAVTYVYAYYDDIAANDTAGSVNNSWIGQGGIYGLRPIANGTTHELTPSIGDNYECVNEVPPSDADYVESATPDEYDTYEMEDLPVVSGTVNAIQVLARGWATEPGATQLACGVRSGGVDYPGDSIPIDLTPWVVKQIMDEDPATGVAWTLSGVNALEAGVVVK